MALYNMSLEYQPISMYLFFLQVSTKLEKTAWYFKNLGNLGFWSQLVCTIVSAGILTFSAVATGDATAPFTFCATSLGIVAAFISVFRSFGYIRLSERLRRTVNEPAKVLPLSKIIVQMQYHFFQCYKLGTAPTHHLHQPLIVAHHLVPVYSHLITASGSYNHAHTLFVAIGLVFTKSAGS